MSEWADKLRALNKPGDGCTASPNGNWVECCDMHDYYYTVQTVTRLEADKRLRKCMAAKGYPVFAWLYFGAVRVFGAAFWNRTRQILAGQTEGLLHG